MCAHNPTASTSCKCEPIPTHRGCPSRIEAVGRREASWDPSRECEFIEPQGKSEDAISPHPKILADARLVHGDRRGKWVWYSVDRAPLVELRSAL